MGMDDGVMWVVEVGRVGYGHRVVVEGGGRIGRIVYLLYYCWSSVFFVLFNLGKPAHCIFITKHDNKYIYTFRFPLVRYQWNCTTSLQRSGDVNSIRCMVFSLSSF